MDMMNGISHQKKTWTYFAVAYGWSWILLVPPALAGLDANQPLVIGLRGLSGIGPALSALFLLYTFDSPQGRREYWKRLLSSRGINHLWWAVILLMPLVLTFLSGGIALFLEEGGLQLESGLPNATNPLGWLGFVIFMLVFGPVPEEMGWRGYALDGLQSRWSPLSSSLVLGMAWSLWHLPLFFIKGTYQANLGIFSDEFWIFCIMMIPESILMTWIYNNTSRSILSAVLFHFAINLTGEIFFLSPTGNWINFGLWILAAGLIVIFTDPKTFRQKIKEKPVITHPT